MGIIHRDVAARNALIGKKEETKISDFGLSLVGAHKKEKKLKKVPVRYLAPETLASGQYSKMTDVWSFGIFMWEVFHNGKEPYSEIVNARDVKKAVLSGYRMGNESDIFPFYLWTLTTKCWEANPLERPCFGLIVMMIQEEIDHFLGKKQFSFRFWR